MKIFVELLDEGTTVRCPVEAIHMGGDLYQIAEVNSDPVDTLWAFNTGAKVRCRPTLTGDGTETILLAYEEISN